MVKLLQLITHGGKRVLLNGLFSMALPSTIACTTPQQQQQKERQQLNRYMLCHLLLLMVVISLYVARHSSDTCVSDQRARGADTQ
jgi:hypothetical protein